MKPDIRNLDFNLLKALDALLDERSVTRAAERLALTQPAVSGMLNRLRDSFDDPLFVRAQRGIVPTPRAQQLAGPVKQLLSDIESMLRPQAFDPALADLTFTIAATDYALKAVVVPFIHRLRPLAPNVRVAVRGVDQQTLVTQFEDGTVDLALLTPETLPAGLHSQQLFEESYVCLLREGHPQARAERFTLEVFCALDHVLVSMAGNAFHGVTDDALARVGRSRRVVTSVSSFLILPELLADSDLIAVVPRRLAQHASGLSSLEPPLAIPGFCKTMAWHGRTHSDAGQQWLRALLADTCALTPTH
ncbi:LysR family transcriptional regulator [Pseudomonas sp. PSKL.D1]|uniref:LysR family transcriptional regulator n=1 Tax=Pseudomonas sp. PSKL.D1 TaxID=3029060 RepID=UPI002380CDD9|nr:LysR family transcriptional regulator [Pseudomonas sp. PSKL.D1]WDY59977.1 LysR family transcriptional regulator [Pseudomonas sp. PSKL.D1]